MKTTLLIQPHSTLSAPSISSSTALTPLVFTSMAGSGYAHLDHHLVSVPESIEHRILRSRKSGKSQPEEFPFTARPVHILHSLWTSMPQMMYLSTIKVIQFTYSLSRLFRLYLDYSVYPLLFRFSVYWNCTRTLGSCHSILFFLFFN